MRPQHPETLVEAADAIRECAHRHRCITISGSATKSGASRESANSNTPLHTRALSRVIEFSPADLTITVEAGITLRALDALLAPHNLRLPLDPPDYDGRATLGGVLATNDSGPLRLAHGTAREHVIGMSMILADGTLIKSGGKVVKNVAGYDLHRLFVGSHGSLGLIATVSLKLKPRAELLRFVTLAPDSLDQAEEWTAALLAEPTRAAILDWLSAPLLGEFSLPHAARPSPAIQIVVGFEDNREAVDWQVDRVCRDFPNAVALDEAQSAVLHVRLREPARDGTRFCARIPSSRVAECSANAAGANFHAHAASGVIHGYWPQQSEPAIADLREFVLSCAGFLTLTRPDCRTEWHRAIDPAARELERRLKARLDPGGVFPPAPFANE